MRTMMMTLLAAMLLPLPLMMTARETHAASKTAGAHAVDPAIARVAESFRSAALKGDATAIAALYREDAVEMPSCSPPVFGRAAIERYYHDMFTNLGTFTSFTLSHLEAEASGDVAFIAGTSRQTLAVPTKGSFDDSGKYVVVLKRTNGAWKVAYSMSGGDHQLLPPPPTSAAQH